MTPERYQQVVELCHAAWEQRPKARGAFLRHACQGDQELRREIEAMLAADEQPGQFLDESPDDIAAQALAARRTRSLVGKTLGDYQVIGLLGMGGMSDVFLAQDMRLGRKAALKLLPEEFTSDPDRLQRFEREARAVSALAHPNIVTVYGMGRSGPVSFLAIEFIAGKTLRVELASGPLGPQIAVEIALQTARALGAAHRVGIIHRDIKPENIILQPDGLVKVLDFGLAKRRAVVDGIDDSSGCTTTSGLIVGTPRYMSPEQARGVSVDFRTDLFSLGSVLYEMLSGRPAMKGETPSDILASVLARNPEPLENSCSECPAALVRLVSRALEKDRHKRYQSAEEMAADLKIVLRQLESGVFVHGAIGSSVPAGPTTPVAISATPSAHTRFSLGALAAVAGALIAIYAIQRIPSRDSEPLTVTPLTALPGNEVQPSLSPDGNQVAFAFDGGRSSNYNIYVKTIGSEEITRLTSDPADDMSPSWSPDGKHIAFLRFPSDQSALVMVMPAAGGAERQLAKLRVERDETEIRVAWSPDGEWIVTSDAETPMSLMRLVLISAATGRKRRLSYQPPALDADLSPSFSPDGRYLAYARHLSFAIADLYVLEVAKEGGPATVARRLTNWNRLNRSPVWSWNGKEVFFVGDEPRIGPRIWRVLAFASGQARRINPVGESTITSITLSPRAGRLVYSKQNDDRNIWRLDLAHVTRERAQAQVSSSPVIVSTYTDGQPQYSPDGKYIAFQSNRSGDPEIWIANSDGSSPRQLTRLHAVISGYPRWSPDSKYIVFHSRPSGYANIYVIEVETGRYRALTSGTTNDAAASWSHNGKWIYFVSERSGISQIWRMPAGGGPAFQITKNGGAIAFDSVDGKMLFYSKFTEAGLWMLSLEGGGLESRILPSLSSLDAFAVTQTGIYFAHPIADSGTSFSFVSLPSRLIREISRIPTPLVSSVSASPDGGSLLYAQADRTGSDLMMVENLN